MIFLSVVYAVERLQSIISTTETIENASQMDLCMAYSTTVVIHLIKRVYLSGWTQNLPKVFTYVSVYLSERQFSKILPIFRCPSGVLFVFFYVFVYLSVENQSVYLSEFLEFSKSTKCLLK